ncbi:uncharacterized protein B0I36DRAFT_364177 [Microdochium trichocladiopsis]|uniref:Uncharacterized protein n=1 Tax=Microdochium trichocladiopsis TaxID=1682393 RepID=A0A9P9BPW5_9PEZI|nr:uncharacterized protein B0I36DRAFT_364177 [Microdochium trichocladiopsis]KAH7029667.1 hypothetical protein B0I36DRAFT_364177 [Microdochium trichocladiopsis]
MVASRSHHGLREALVPQRVVQTGRHNLGAEPLPKTGGSGVAAVLPVIRPLVENIRQPHVPMFFCVDEANQRRHAVAEMLAAEGGWDLEWCVAACEAEGVDALDRVREWLANWAPMKAA